MAAIEISKVSKNFGVTEVLRAIDLEISDGEFITLVGPSGCGKSTLLRIIAGLEVQSAGDIKINGQNVNDVRASKRDLAMVFQSYALYPHLSVRQNMMTPLKLRNLNFWERIPLLGSVTPSQRTKLASMTQVVNEVADTLKIDQLLDRKPGQLSGGQRQRVALGRAMVRKPAAFLMDEPLSNLDAALRVHMRSELAALHRSLDTTFIYVTHDQAEALTMSDRMAVMMDGKILQLGTPDEVYKNPCDMRVAEFIGSPKINILPGTVDNDHRVFLYDNCIERKLNQQNKKIRIGIRPEHIDCVTSKTAKGIAAKVTHKENLGSDHFIHGHINDTQILIARVNPAQSSSLKLGENIIFTLNTQNCLAFDDENNRLNFLD